MLNENILRHQIVEEARTYLGTKHIHQARLKGVGVDCAGMLIGVAKTLNAIPPNYVFDNYSEQNDGSDLRNELLKFCYEISLDEILPGDIVTMSVYGNPQHCGFITDVGLIHALDYVVETNISDKWRDRFVAAYRINGVRECS